MRRMRLSLCAFLLIPSLAAAATPPDWVRSGGTSSKFPSETHLVGFAMAPDTSVDAAKNGAAADLATRITVRIENETSSVSAEKNGAGSFAVSALTRATTDVRLSGLSFETFVGDGHAYAFAFVARSEAVAQRKEQRDRAIARARELLASAEKAEKEGHEAAALSACYGVRVAVAEAAEEDSIGRAIQRDQMGSFEGASLIATAEERIRKLLHRPSSTIVEAVATLALQLKQQGITNQARCTVAPLTYGTTPFSSAFGKQLSLGVERALADTAGQGTAKGDLVLKGTYLAEGGAWKVALLVREASTGRAIASAEVALPKAAVSPEIATLPVNFEQALKDQRLLGEGESVSGDLHLEVWTNKGRSNLVFSEKEELTLNFRVNRPAYVRLIYILSDGNKVPLQQAYFVDASKVNMAVEYPDKFEISPPFGVERIYAVAFTQKPEPLPTKHVMVGGQDYEVVNETTEALVHHRGLKKKEAALQIAEATLPVTTTPP